MSPLAAPPSPQYRCTAAGSALYLNQLPASTVAKVFPPLATALPYTAPPAAPPPPPYVLAAPFVVRRLAGQGDAGGGGGMLKR